MPSIAIIPTYSPTLSSLFDGEGIHPEDEIKTILSFEDQKHKVTSLMKLGVEHYDSHGYEQARDTLSVAENECARLIDVMDFKEFLLEYYFPIADEFKKIGDIGSYLGILEQAEICTTHHAKTDEMDAFVHLEIAKKYLDLHDPFLQPIIKDLLEVVKTFCLANRFTTNLLQELELAYRRNGDIMDADAILCLAETRYSR